MMVKRTRNRSKKFNWRVLILYMKKILSLLYKKRICLMVLFFILLYLVGFRITYSPRLENSWEAISAIADWAGVIATILVAYVLYKKEKEIRPIIRIIGNYVGQDNFCLKVYNSSKTDLVIKTILLLYGNNQVGSVYCENNDYTDILQEYFIIDAGKVIKVNLPFPLFQSQLGEFYDRDHECFYEDFLREIQNKNLKIIMTDIEENTYSYETEISFDDYVNKLNDK